MELKRAAEGLTIVAIGSILLANTLGYLPWSVWWSILSLWPLLIVAAGIDIVGRGTDNTWLRVLSSLLVIGGLLYGALVMTPTGGWLPIIMINGSTESSDFDLSEPHDAGVKTGVAEISGGVGDLSIDAGSALVSAEGETPFDGPVFDVTVSGDEADVVVGLGQGSSNWPNGSHSRLDTKLDRSVVWDLTVKTGVATSKIDLSDVKVSALKVDAGVSDTVLTLGRISSAVDVRAVRVELEAGVSSIKVRVPEESQVRILVRGGLSAIDIPSGFDRVSESGGDKRYETDGFDSGDAYYDIVIQAGIGNIDIERY